MRKEFLPALVWASIILVLCGIPGNRIPEPTFWKWLGWDKLTHLFLFGTLALLLLRGEEKHTGRYPVRKKIYSWISIVIGYGALIEVLQATVFIDRSGDIRDAVANATGAIIGAFLFKRIRKNHRTNDHTSQPL